MASTSSNKARPANKALYAPRRKPLPERVHCKAPEWHPVGDDVLKKIRDRR